MPRPRKASPHTIAVDWWTSNHQRQRYNPHALTKAHAAIPVGESVRVTNTKNRKSVVVLVSDHIFRECARQNLHLTFRSVRAKN
jgi:hypothetical protein